MKLIQVSMGHEQKNLEQLRTGLIEEFCKPKNELQYITKLKEIKKYLNESVWDFDQRFKTMMAKVNFKLSDVQHKEWFIAALVPHIIMPLM